MNTCRHCGKETDNKKFCSRSCAAKTNNVGVRRHGEAPSECQWCGENLKNRNSAFCSISCHKKCTFWSYINRWMIGLETGAKTNSFTVSETVRNYLKIIHKNKCSKCGWGEANPCNGKIYLEVDHLDGNCTNNRFENLDLICPNCHSLTPTYKSLNIGNGSKERIKYCKVINR